MKYASRTYLQSSLKSIGKIQTIIWFYFIHSFILLHNRCTCHINIFILTNTQFSRMKTYFLVKKSLKDTFIINKFRTHPFSDKFSTNRNFPRNLTYKSQHNKTLNHDKYSRSSNKTFLQNTKNETNNSNRNSHKLVRFPKRRPWQFSLTIFLLENTARISIFLLVSNLRNRWRGHAKKPETVSRSTTNENWRG